MRRPLVTIGLTTYNAAQTVERAVASALAQTWRPIEIVAVDDHSSDDTLAILEHLASIYPELRVFHNAINGGVAVSRNRIVSEARGDFVAFFDDDDESLPERVAAQYERITSYEREHTNGALIICHTSRRVIYPQGEVRIETTMGTDEGRCAPSGPSVARRILLGTPLEDGYGACPTCSQMARLSAYRSLGGFDTTFRRGEDTDFNIRLALSGGHFVGIASALVVQQMTKTSEKSLEEEYRNMLLIMKKHRQFMEDEGQYEFCLAWVHMKQMWMESRRVAFVGMLLDLLLRHPSLTARRFKMAMRNLQLNKAFSQFHGAR